MFRTSESVFAVCGRICWPTNAQPLWKRRAYRLVLKMCDHRNHVDHLNHVCCMFSVSFRRRVVTPPTPTDYHMMHVFVCQVGE
jgi:hypothetical protein